MKLTINGKELELKYSFNSFAHMEDLDFTELNDIQTKPFKIVKVLSILILGALNFDADKEYSKNDVSSLLEEYMKDNSLVDLMESLIAELQESDFFKNLQKN